MEKVSAASVRVPNPAPLHAAANPRDRRVDPEVARFRHLAGNEGEGPADDAEERRAGGSLRLIDELVQHHPGAGGKLESGAVIECDADRAIGAGFERVASE